MPLQSKEVEFLHEWSFRVEIDDFTVTDFMECSGLKQNVSKIQTWQGGSVSPVQEPGRVTFDDVTLRRGYTGDRSFYTWAKLCANVSANAGVRTQRLKRNFDIVALRRDGTTAARWRVKGAWPTSFTAGAWNNDSDNAQVEELVLAIDDFHVISGSHAPIPW